MSSEMFLHQVGRRPRLSTSIREFLGRGTLQLAKRFDVQRIFTPQFEPVDSSNSFSHSGCPVWCYFANEPKKSANHAWVDAV